MSHRATNKLTYFIPIFRASYKWVRKCLSQLLFKQLLMPYPISTEEDSEIIQSFFSPKLPSF